MKKTDKNRIKDNSINWPQKVLSFRKTKKKIDRKIKLDGCWKFFNEAAKFLADHKKTFCLLLLLYIIIVSLTVAADSQSNFTFFKSVFNSTSSSKTLNGYLGGITKAGLLFVSTLVSNGSNSSDGIQQIYLYFFTIMLVLSTIWLSRHFIAGKNKIKVRDAIYSAGSPIIGEMIISFVLLLEIIPFIIAVICYNSAIETDFLSNPIRIIGFVIVILLLASLTVYWISGSLMAIIITTLPGAYPIKSLKSSFKLTKGRRMMIIGRILFALLILLLIWATLGLIVVLVVSNLSKIWSVVDNIPIVPVFIAAMSGATIIFITCYIYRLYRRIIETDAD